MKKILIIPALILFALFVRCGSDDDNGNNGKGNGEIVKFDPVAVTKSNPMKLYVHYMPWFETKETNNGVWGQHWTMANKNPDKTDANGNREIASHYYPLIGPYASSDVAVIEYHLLLMKYSGIDGILIDWYGTRNKHDYAANKKNTEAIVSVLEKVGLDFAIVYEDQTLKDDLSDSEKITQAKADMKYLESNFFNKANYIKVDNKPLLMIFGPQQIKTPANWNNIFSTLNVKPTFVTLYGHSHQANNNDFKDAAGEYIWVDGTPMGTKYGTKDNFDVFIGGAYPGFKDYYQQGGWGQPVLSPIDYKDGALFDELLQMAKSQNVSYLQLITWNDFGEGTMIEPTKEFGYKFLNKLQTFSGVTYNTSVLENVYEYYKLKEANKGNATAEKTLLQAFYYYISLQNNKAKEVTNELKNK